MFETLFTTSSATTLTIGGTVLIIISAFILGLACGMGYIAYAALFAVLLCGIMVALSLIKFGVLKNSPMKIKITVPEDMDYPGAFDDIMKNYTNSYKLQKVKTTDFGSLFELVYDITLKNDASSKEFIDKLRCRNGNLNIVLNLNEQCEPTSF